MILAPLDMLSINTGDHIYTISDTQVQLLILQQLISLVLIIGFESFKKIHMWRKKTNIAKTVKLIQYSLVSGIHVGGFLLLCVPFAFTFGFRNFDISMACTLSTTQSNLTQFLLLVLNQNSRKFVTRKLLPKIEYEALLVRLNSCSVRNTPAPGRSINYLNHNDVVIIDLEQ